MRVRQHTELCYLPLAPIENAGGACMKSFRADASCAKVFEIFDSDFADLLVRPAPRPSPAVSRGFGKGDLPHIHALTVPAEGEVFLAKWFKVPKSNMTSSRLVQALGQLSKSLDPPKVPFTNLHALIEKILKAKRAAIGDLKNWFYQIPIPLAWRKWFAAKIASARGEFEVRCLIVLSMGLAISVFIAQVFSLAIAARIARHTLLSDAWVDNLIWLAYNDHDFDGFDERVREAAAHFNIKWSEVPEQHTSFDFIGLHFDLTTKRASLCDKMKTKLLACNETLNGRPDLTLREALGAIGLTVWSNYAVGRYPLAFFEQLLRWLSTVCAAPNKLDEAVLIPPAVQSDILRLAQLCAAAHLTLDDLESPPTPGITAFSDASDSALASVVLRDGHPHVSVCPTDDSLPIFAREALAHLMAVLRVPRGMPAAGFAIDNTNHIHACTRGHSRNPDLNAVLRRLYHHLSEADFTAFTGYVPSRLQLADYPTRQRALPADWDTFFRLPLSLRRIPFFRPPPS
jgi:hypothetical protein